MLRWLFTLCWVLSLLRLPMTSHDFSWHPDISDTSDMSVTMRLTMPAPATSKFLHCKLQGAGFSPKLAQGRGYGRTVIVTCHSMICAMVKASYIYIYMAFWHWPSIGGFLMMGTSTHMIGETTVTFGIYGNPTFDNGTYSTYSIWWFDCLMCFTHVPTKIISHTRMRFRAHSLQGWKSG